MGHTRFRINKENNPSGKHSRTISTHLDADRQFIQSEFTGSADVIYWTFDIGRSSPAMLVYISEITDRELLNRDVITPLTSSFAGYDPSLSIDCVKDHIRTANIQQTHYWDNIINNLLNGKSILFMEGQKSALILPTEKWKSRALSEPQSEVVSKGPRNGFIENIDTNKMLLRGIIKNQRLVLEDMKLGTHTQTAICVAYIGDLVNPSILEEVKKRLRSIDIDAALNSGYIEELISDHPISPFNTIGYSERPDTVAGKLLEGRIAILCDGSPNVLTVPFLFLENFQNNEDYYNHFIIASISRLTRLFAFILTVFTPGIYVALVCFHHELIPEMLLLSFISARSGVPFPTIVEVIIMLLLFDVLRESGLRLPRALGQTVSIVGALVLGQAAVEAKFVSAPVIIIVAVTAISSFIFFRIDGALMIYRMIILLLSSSFGLYGVLWGMSLMLLNLVSMRSFGIAYMSYLGSFQKQEFKDTVIRAPWWYMYIRPQKIAFKNYRRQRRSS